MYFRLSFRGSAAFFWVTIPCREMLQVSTALSWNERSSHRAFFDAMVAFVKKARWDGVPFILKASKALIEQRTQMCIQFNDFVLSVF